MRLIADLKAAVDPVEIIGQYVPLRRSGGWMLGRCPFHDDSKPSFGVSRRTGNWRCFSCDARGDVVEFLQRINGWSLVEAVRELERVSGFEPAAPSDEVSSRLRRLKLTERELRLYEEWLRMLRHEAYERLSAERREQAALLEFLRTLRPFRREQPAAAIEYERMVEAVWRSVEREISVERLLDSLAEEAEQGGPERFLRLYYSWTESQREALAAGVE